MLKVTLLVAFQSSWIYHASASAVLGRIAADQDLFKALSIGGLNPTTSYTNNGGLPLISPEGYSDVGGANWLPTTEYNNVWDFIQNVSINKGKHAVKFGYEYRPIKFPFFQVPSARGQFRFPRNRTAIPEQPG